MTSQTWGAQTSAQKRPDATVSRGRVALAGFLAIAVTLGVSEILAGALPGGRSHVIAVGDAVIDATPGWLERAAISSLGTADKPFLIATSWSSPRCSAPLWGSSRPGGSCSEPPAWSRWPPS